MQSFESWEYSHAWVRAPRACVPPPQHTCTHKRWLTLLAVGLLFLVLAAGGAVLWWVFEPVRAASRRRFCAAADAAERELWRREQQRLDVDRLGCASPRSCYLTVVIPAYNERERLPAMLRSATEYLVARVRSSRSFSVEVLVVDDGSRDGTAEVAATLGAELLERALFDGDERTRCAVRVARLSRNRGKGGAVREGALRAAGRWVLVVDADGATLFSDLARLERAAGARCQDSEESTQPCVVAVGSRAHLVGTVAVARRSPLRNALMRGFHLLVRTIGGVHGVRDTQCGFKLLSRAAARHALGSLHLERWAFDVELLFVPILLHRSLGGVEPPPGSLKKKKKNLQQESPRRISLALSRAFCFFVRLSRRSRRASASRCTRSPSHGTRLFSRARDFLLLRILLLSCAQSDGHSMTPAAREYSGVVRPFVSCFLSFFSLFFFLFLLFDTHTHFLFLSLQNRSTGPSSAWPRTPSRWRATSPACASRMRSDSGRCPRPTATDQKKDPTDFSTYGGRRGESTQPLP